MSKITCYIMLIDWLFIAYWLPLIPMCSAIMDMGPGPGPKKGASTAAGTAAFLGPGPGPGPGPISMMPEHMGMKGNQ